MLDVGFFSYEGRGIHMGDSPPRYETIERELYDTSTLDNKVLDLDHSLDITAYFLKDTLPAGHQAIFECIDDVAGER